MGRRFDGTEYEIRDDKAVLDFFAQAWKETDMGVLAKEVLNSAVLWPVPPAEQVPGLVEKTAFYLEKMQHASVQDVVAELVK